MICLHCEHVGSVVKDTRHTDDGIRRYRQCMTCKQRFATDEFCTEKKSRRQRLEMKMDEILPTLSIWELIELQRQTAVLLLATPSIAKER